MLHRCLRAYNVSMTCVQFNPAAARRLAALIIILGSLTALPQTAAAQTMPVLRDNALIEAARAGHTEVLTTAQQNGAQLDRRGVNGQNALQVAAEWGRTDAVRLLLQWGAKPDLRGKNGHTALTQAVFYGRAEIVALLLAAGADVDRSGPDYETPLIMATRLGHAALVDALLAAGARVDETDATGRTAFDWARIQRDRDLTARLQAAQ